MAAAIIPLVATVLPFIKPVVQDVVLAVEKLFGPKTGATKFDTAMKMLKPVLDALSTAGKIPGVLDNTQLGTILETVVQDLNQKGLDTVGQSTTSTQSSSVTPSLILPGGQYTLTGTIQISQ